MDPIQANIANVTRLWANAAKTFDRYYESEGYGYGYIPKSQWPNKIWLHDIPSGDNLKEIGALMALQKPELTLVYFDRGAPGAIDCLRNFGFTETFFLYGMSLMKPFALPTQPNDTYASLELERVTRPKDRREWSRAFQAAFGYSISEETLAGTQQEIRYFLLRARGQTVGTLALFWTGATAGIYSMGIVPEARGRGYAMEAMQKALIQSALAGAESVVLQASAMGLPMYEKLGFTTDFTMRNYSLKSISNEIT